MKRILTLSTALAALALATAFSGCGGGGGGGSTTTTVSTPTTATVTGTVLNSSTSQPISGVVVTVVSTSLTATTNSSGQFSIAGVPANTAEVLDFTLTNSLLGTKSITATTDPDNLGNVSVNDSSSAPGPPPI